MIWPNTALEPTASPPMAETLSQFNACDSSRRGSALVVRRQHTLMKTYNTKLGVRVFTIIAAVDVVMLVIGHFHPGGLIAIPFVIINSPALLLADLFGKLRSWGTGGSFILCLLLCALFWSFIASYVFRRRVSA